jgi:uncharacterized membrane protein YtjA (UPF0391 family)
MSAGIGRVGISFATLSATDANSGTDALVSRRNIMGLLKWALLFLVLAVIAALFGFTGIAHGFEDIAKVLFGIFIVIMVVLFIIGITAYKAVT